LVDINATATYEVLLDKANDSVAGWTNTAKDGTGTPVQPIADSDGHLQVDVLSGGGAGEQYPDAEAVGVAKKGNLVLGTDGTNYQVIKVDADGNIQVDVLSAPTTAVTGTFYQATQPVSGAVTPAPGTSGGCLISRLLSAATTNATVAKASAGQVYGWYITNTNAAVRYVKLYNKATAPTVGTDTPVMTLAIPGAIAGAGTNVEFSLGIPFASGIGYATTVGAADSDVGAVALNEIIINLLYK
ncbi:hypothetical protein, partial [Candidatus Oleimmundimicrobium sp.]|uniref:hypothetical protein n=1 Tax=Candidatus Oleimmundimicrobium sp. TaxID=3060597 RepID=UPI0027247E54